MESIKLFQQNLPPVAVDLLRIALWLVLLAAVFVPLEKLFPRKASKTFRARWLTDLAYYFLNSLVPKLVLILIFSAVMSGIVQYGPSQFYQWVGQMPTSLRFAAAIVVGEIGAYWGHRLMHQIPFLWRMHAVHHSAEHLDWLVNTRAHPLDMIITRACGLLPIYLLGLAQPTGLSDSVAVAYALFGTIWSFVIHANVNWRLGFLEQIISTPAFHHWHHTKDSAETIDKNFAAIFPWVDRLFGTLYLPAHWPKQYGVDTPLVADGIVKQLIQPFTNQNKTEITP
jgi:sterol desaturase/sphingolipid hydroxylase (fatty acid hydroxylase superfamily)